MNIKSLFIVSVSSLNIMKDHYVYTKFKKMCNFGSYFNFI